MATYEEAPASIVKLVQKVVDEHHERRNLQNARIGVIARDDDSTRGEGKAIKVTPQMQLFMEYDFIIWIDKWAMGGWETARLEALIDHILCHCTYVGEEARLVKPEIQEFAEIIQRRGYWNRELLGLQAATDRYEQLGFASLKDKLKASGSVESVTISINQGSPLNEAEKSGE